MDELAPLAKERSVEGAAPPRRVRTPRHTAPSAPASVFVHSLLLAAVSATVFLAAGPAQGSLGIFLLAAGVALTFCPARVKVEWPLWLCAAGLVGCGALAFLPARWFPAPAWRTVLGGATAIHLPSTVTPVPWETGFWLGLLGLSFLTGLFLLAHPVRSRTLLWLAAAGVAMCGVYAALSIYAKQAGWHYPFAGGATFGFFPNRNHTATFLVTGSITALGVLTVGLREGRWTFSALVAAAMTACVAGLFFYSGSRAGVIFLIVGTLIWVSGLGGAHRSMPLVVSVIALAVSAGLLFVVSGGEARARLLGSNASPTASPTPSPLDANPPPGEDRDAAPDFRVLIYKDAMGLIKDAPLTGAGLGAFAPVFAQYRHASLSASAALHPESDWIMLAAEAGAPALVFILAVAMLLLLRVRGAADHPYWPLRWACMAAAAAAALHGIVDVPAHRIALGWWILLLAGFGAQAGGKRDAKRSIIQRGLFVVGGLAALALGVGLIRAEWFGGSALPPFAAGAAQAKIAATYERGDMLAAYEQARDAVEVSPLAAPLYYQLGVAMMHFEDSEAEVEDAFKAQRLLNPVWPTIPLQQGYAWITVDPKKTADLWLEAIDRQSRIDRVQGASSGLLPNYYRELVVRAKEWPAVQGELSGAIDRGPDFLLAWLETASPALVREKLPAISTRFTLLKTLNAAQREKFLFQWYAKGDRTDLARFLESEPTWQESAWLVHLYELAAARQFESLVRAAAEHYRVSLALPSRALPSDAVVTNDIRITRFSELWTIGNTAEARLALNDSGHSVLPADLAEYWRLETALAAYDHEWLLAWENLKTGLRVAHSADPLP